MDKIRIRAAKPEDGPALAPLSAQLGYPDPAEAIAGRLRGILRRWDHAVFVAEDESGRLLGWIHIFIRPLLILVPHAEVGGLVVDEQCRGEGVGQALLKAAESWARSLRLEQVLIRSRESRVQAHAFYETQGYTRLKISHTFMKSLEESA
ncbi:MAG TPA: GNAT family N-acetyltransferase [Chloroflexi bacterium]|nr:GNAT family N-acetyltransferase [Chloroflexota bacterium]